MPICALCGAESRGAGQFCTQCGGPVAGATAGVLVATQESAPDSVPASSPYTTAEHRDGTAPPQDDVPVDLQEALRLYNAGRFKTAVMCLERAVIQAQQNDDRRAGEKIIEIGSALAANRLVHPKLRQECEASGVPRKRSLADSTGDGLLGVWRDAPRRRRVLPGLRPSLAKRLER